MIYKLLKKINNKINSQKNSRNQKNDVWEKFLNIKKISSELFFYNQNLSNKDKRNMFKKYINEIGIETNSFCNRSCDYCPRSIYKRETNENISDDIFNKIIYELQEINYDKIINLNLYNEPLSDSTIYEKIKKIRNALPNAYIKFNSNGDYITKEKIDILEKIGTNAIYITMQVNSGEKYNDDVQKNRIYNFLKKISIESEIQNYIPNKSINLSINYKNMHILIMSNNWNNYGVDRGGTLNNLSIKQRIAPCIRIFREIQIDYKGQIHICCNIYPESPDSSKYCVGDLNNNNLYDIYFSPKFTAYRRILYEYSSKPSPCDTCNDFQDGKENIITDKRRKNILKMLELQHLIKTKYHNILKHLI